MSYLVQTHNLTKTFTYLPGHDVVSKVNMNVPKGGIYGFLGPNGAGKTTIMKMMVNLFKPSIGSVEIFGEKVSNHSYKMLKRIGSIIETPAFYDNLSGKENLALYAEYMGFYSKGDVEKTLNLLGLSGAEHKIVGSYSLGMRQRLGIARAILTKPELLILDEPINGLDPAGVKAMRDLFLMLCHEYGITIIISSHIISEVEQIADTIGIINHGKLLEEITMDDIHEKSMEYIEFSTNDISAASYVLSHTLDIQNFKAINEQVIRIYGFPKKIDNLTAALVQNNIRVDSINQKSGTLEEYFLNMTGEAI